MAEAFRATFAIRGLKETLAVTDRLGKETKKAVRDELRSVAVPIRDDAQRRFQAEISPDTRKSRYGVSVRRSGTVAVEQRVKSKYSRSNRKLKRPKFADLQLDEILIPAGNAHEADVTEAMDNVLERIQRKWVTG